MPALFPVAYFGSISYYQKMVQAEVISLELFENYVKQSLRNRMSILGPNGIQNLSIPVIKVDGNKTLTKNISISNAENWQKTHWRAIESAYAPSPYFEHYGNEVKELIYSSENNLVSFNLRIHKTIVDWLQLPVQTGFTGSYEVPQETGKDFRNAFKERELNSNHKYVQVFNEGNEFVSDLSILDAIFNLGPMARKLFTER